MTKLKIPKRGPPDWQSQKLVLASMLVEQQKEIIDLLYDIRKELRAIRKDVHVDVGEMS